KIYYSIIILLYPIMIVWTVILLIIPLFLSYTIIPSSQDQLNKCKVGVEEITRKCIEDLKKDDCTIKILSDLEFIE
ncbi:MAG: hypothetical protein AAGF07_04745, partial [Patescibacteria group bacterium]